MRRGARRNRRDKRLLALMILFREYPEMKRDFFLHIRLRAHSRKVRATVTKAERAAEQSIKAYQRKLDRQGPRQ